MTARLRVARAAGAARARAFGRRRRACEVHCRRSPRDGARERRRWLRAYTVRAPQTRPTQRRAHR
eukprot:4531491-Pleurochrysis_carterae.AAC.1